MFEIKLDLEEFELSEIESIEFVGEEETIDITVEDTHMFFANDIYTHNSGFKNDLNDELSIGKAITPLQVADILMTHSQPPDLAVEGKTIVLLLKNRLGPKNIVIECAYDPNMGVFTELREVPELLTLNNNVKKQVREAASSAKDMLKQGFFDKKNK